LCEQLITEVPIHLFQKGILLSTSGLYNDAVHKSYATVLICK